jgi:hypothetical protein
LAERAEQEIVYHDVSLRGSTTAEQQQRQRDAMASIGEDEEEEGYTNESIDRFQPDVDWEPVSSS